MTVKAKADAIDRFVRTLKGSGGLWDDIQAACIMAGWTNLAGALYPLKGAAPTNNGFLAADLDAGIGLRGNGSTKYLDSNRNNNADGQNDKHMAVYASQSHTSGAGKYPVYVGTGAGAVGSSVVGRLDNNSTTAYVRVNSSAYVSALNSGGAAGCIGASRASPSQVQFRANAATESIVSSSETPYASNLGIFRSGSGGEAASYSNATLSWYSIGSSTDLAALDSAVSALMSDLRSIDEQGFDRDALAYIRAVEAADGAYLETGVKKAINRFIVGCKKDGIWDALKASCIMCGARTLAGALVPLAGTAPTPYNFASGDYNRETGLKGNGTTKYLNTNRANNADGQDDNHNAVYVTTANTVGIGALCGAGSGLPGSTNVGSNVTSGWMFFRSRTAGFGQVNGAQSATGLVGINRSTASTYQARVSGGSTAINTASDGVVASNVLVFARPDASGVPVSYTDASIAFYSIGSAISDLAALDARVSTLVSEIAAAIP